MFNIFGALGALGRFLPGYINGREQAISANWNDMNQYNQVQNGQLQNAWTELNFPLRYNESIDQASMSRDKAQLSQLGLADAMTLFPLRLAASQGQALQTLEGQMNPQGVGGGQGGQGAGGNLFAQMKQQLMNMGYSEADAEAMVNARKSNMYNNWVNPNGKSPTAAAPNESNMPTVGQQY